MSKLAEYLHRGDTINYKNAGDAKIEANQIVLVGELVGVAGTEIPAGETGSLFITSIWDFPKDSAEIAAGAPVYYTDDGGASATKGSGAVKIGHAVQAAAADDTTVRVKINV